MTPAKFASYIREATHTDSTSLTDAQILAIANPIKEELSLDIVRVDEDILLIPKLANLVEDQREYPLPLDMVGGFRSLYAMLDGTNYVKLTEMKFHNITFPLTETEITARFSNIDGEAFFIKYRKSIYILSGSITSVTNGLKIYPQEFPADFSALTDTTTDMSVDPTTNSNGFPRELHKLWADMVIASYKQNRPRPLPLNEEEKKIELRKRNILHNLREQSMDTNNIMTIPSASSRGNNGYNY